MQEYAPSGACKSAGNVDVVRGHRSREDRTCPDRLVKVLLYEAKRKVFWTGVRIPPGPP
jgi:hypothetical protein